MFSLGVRYLSLPSEISTPVIGVREEQRDRRAELARSNCQSTRLTSRSRRRSFTGHELTDTVPSRWPEEVARGEVGDLFADERPLLSRVPEVHAAVDARVYADIVPVTALSYNQRITGLLSERRVAVAARTNPRHPTKET